MNPINKILAYACLSLFLTSSGFGYLSYKFHAEKALVESSMLLVQASNRNLSNEIDLLKKSQTISTVVLENTIKNERELEGIAEQGVDEIDRLYPLKCLQKPVEKTKEMPTDEEGVADIDDKLPADLRNSLHNTYNNLRNKNNPTQTK